MEKTKKICKTCKFFRPCTEYGLGFMNHDGRYYPPIKESDGRCMFNPSEEQKFNNDWCGQWKKK